MTHLTLLETADLLKISKASVKNWEKHGYLTPVNSKYSAKEVEDLKIKIERGEVQRLKSRANKVTSKEKFIPTEYIDPENGSIVIEIIDFITKYNIKPEQALFLLSVNIFNKLGEFTTSNLGSVVEFGDPSLFKRERVYYELKKWFGLISSKPINIDNKYCSYLLNCNIPTGTDILGLIYQSITSEGKKSNLGSYYTPRNIVENLLSSDRLDFSKVLDPCCGTGQFLLEMAKKVDSPESLWGSDIDPIAVQIARLNMFFFFKNRNISPNIYTMNSLLDLHEDGFSIIATNPPWGAKIPGKELKHIRKRFPEINSKESFSFFLNLALEKLDQGGHYLFVLPTSFLYVKNHSDIRSLLLVKSSIERINPYGRAFKKVFSSVITLEGVKGLSGGSIDIGADYSISQNRFLSNYNRIFNIETNNTDQIIIDKLFSYPNLTLKGRATWALGIVTGNNSKFLKDEYTQGLSPIYRGRDIGSLDLNVAEKFIEFKRESFQQCAPDEYYFAPEKLIYKFISNKLSFSYDNKQSLTLNSANILIPDLPGYSIKSVGAVLNSNLYNFIFKKLINPLKILRGDLEMLPFPQLDRSQSNEMEIEIEESGEVNRSLYRIFNLTNDEIATVENLFSENT